MAGTFTWQWEVVDLWKGAPVERIGIRARFGFGLLDEAKLLADDELQDLEQNDSDVVVRNVHGEIIYSAKADKERKTALEAGKL